MLALLACTPAPDPGGRPATTPPVPAPAPVSASVVEVQVLDPGRHHLAVEVSVEPPAPATLTCTTSLDPAERHVIAGEPGVLAVYGLLADTQWDCVVEAGGGRWSGSVTTPTADPDLPELTVVVDRGDSDGAYTLLDHFVNGADIRRHRVLVVDPEGRVRWSWTLDEGVLPDVDFRWVPARRVFLVGGGSGYAPRFVALDGTVTWTAQGPRGDGWYHHHTEVLADGTVLSLATELGTWNGEPYEGVQLETRDPDDEQVTWEWHGQDALQAGDLPPPDGPGDEPWHANAVSFADDADGPAAYVSFKWLDRWVRVDRDTGAVTWQLGRGGDFALVDALGAPLPDAEWFYGQHDPEWDPATGRLLVYDNGEGRLPAYSRVLELELDLALRTATPMWSWSEPGWYEPLYGDADRLPGGHVLVAMGHCACAGDPERVGAVVEVDPATDEVVWRLELGDPRGGLYRAERVDGCSLFSNGAYCPLQ